MPLNLIFTQAGNFSLVDNGIPGDGISAITDGSGVTIFTFLHPADALGFTQNVPGVNITANFLDIFDATDVSIGSLASPMDSINIQNLVTNTGDLALFTIGAIRETASDAGADLVGTSLIMSAGTGIGATGGSIETAVIILEAETTDGAINITNFGGVTIGGLTADVAGLTGGATGNVTVKNYGSISLSDADGGESVAGSASGDVTLTAIGYNSNITSLVNNDSITATGGDIKLTAGGIIAFGTAGAGFDNDVRAKGDIIINAGGTFAVDSAADIASDDFGAETGGSVRVTAGNGILVSGSDGSIAASGLAGGDVILTASSGGVTLSDFGSVTSNSGDVNLTSDSVLIAADTAIAATAGKVTIKPFNEGTAINLGLVGDPFMTLALSDAEIDRIFTPTLVIGGPDAGPITVSSSISPLNATSLVLQSESDINVGASAISVAGDLTLRAGNNFSAAAAGLLSAGGNVTVLVDFGNTDPGVGGTASAKFITTSVTFTGEADDDTINAGSGNDALNGAGGDDILNGSDGQDTLNGGSGADNMAGGLGDDTYIVDSTSDQVTDVAFEGKDIVKSSVTWTLGSETEDLTLTGASNRSAFGNNNNNVITGNSGNNTIDGKKGDDTIVAGGGTDTITGGRGLDTLTGNGGTDTFLYTETAESSGGSTDLITDFHIASDLIDVHLIDAKSGTVGNQTFTYIGAAAFSAEGQVRAIQSGADTSVQFNTTGTGGAEMVIVLKDFTATDLAASDFVL